MRIMLAITLLVICAKNTFAQDFTMHEALATDIPVYIAKISRTRYETIDGSAQIGRIISELEAGWVLFGPCTGNVLRQKRESLRETKVACDDEPNGPPGGIWSVSCNTTKSAILTRAIVDALKGETVGGEVYRIAQEGANEVEQLDKFANSWKSVGNAYCIDYQHLEMQYLNSTEAALTGISSTVDLGKGLITLYPPEN